PDDPHFPDAFVVVIDATNLERNLLLLSQLYDLHLPLIVALTMDDLAENKSWKTDTQLLSKRLGGIPVIPVNGRSGEGINELKAAIKNFRRQGERTPFCNTPLPDLFEKPQGQSKDAEFRYEKIRSLLKDVTIRSNPEKKESL